MFVEFEDKIVDALKASVKEVPKGNIIVGVEGDKVPSIYISNIFFKIERSNLSEDEEGERINEVFDGDGSQKRYLLRGKPESVLSVESPKGKVLQIWDQYTVNLEEGSVTFRHPPAKDSKIIINYVSKIKKLKVVRLKLKAKYSFTISSEDRRQLDSTAEGVIRSLLKVERELEQKGFSLKPSSGKYLSDNKIKLFYHVELEIESAEAIPPIEKIEIRESHEA
ncbi:MAG: hypothetical protein QXJ17_05580 [Nitrososphaeria archaeon]